MERKPTLVVALGGNALLKRGEPLEAEIQRQNIEQAARTIAGLTAQWRVVLVHGNGPQVGLLALQNSAYDKVTPYPLDVLGAESQGMIGYMLQQALKNSLPQREVSVLLTQVEVDAADPAFSNPTKYIGPVYSEAQAKTLAAEKGWVFKADGSYVRRVVPSPQPKRIVESDAITALIQRDHLVICNGGGGVPVFETDKGYEGVPAVIDKDRSSAKLAADFGADMLVILTAVEKVCINFNKPDQEELSTMTVAEAREYIAQGQFAPGSMLPKVEACIEYVEAFPKGKALITSLECAAAGLEGKTGTVIVA